MLVVVKQAISLLLPSQCIVVRNLSLDGRLTELDGAGQQFASLLVRLLHDADDRCLVTEDLILDTSLLLLTNIPLFLKFMERCQLDECLRSLFTLHKLKIGFLESKFNLFAKLRYLRLEVKGHAFKLLLAHDLRLEDQLVAVELVLPLELIVPSVLNALKTGFHSPRKSANDVSLEPVTAITDNGCGASASTRSLRHKVLIAVHS